MIADAIAVAVQAMVYVMQNAKVAQGGARNGPRGNGSDPLAKRLEVFANIGVLKFSEDEGPMASFKWIFYTRWMVYVPTKREQRDLLCYQMIGNALDL